MGETLSLFEPSFNGSVRVETRSERFSGDAGFLLLREVLDDSGVIDHLAGQSSATRAARSASCTRYRSCCARP